MLFGLLPFLTEVPSVNIITNTITVAVVVNMAIVVFVFQTRPKSRTWLVELHLAFIVTGQLDALLAPFAALLA